jgi:hypothetical protein
MTKRPVAQALARLTEFLRLRGATPFVCLLPQTDGHKCGVDDFLGQEHTLRPMRGQAVVDATTTDITITGLHRLGMAVHNRDMVEEAIHAVFGRHRLGAVSRKFGTPG